MGVDGMPRRPFLAHAIYASGPGEISLRQASLVRYFTHSISLMIREGIQ